MTTNLYDPPEAVVADVDTLDTTPEPPFFAVSITKLVVMSLCTLGLYEVLWFYVNWKRVKARENSDLWPVPRAIFALFFCWQLFSRVRRYPTPSNANAPLAAGALAIGWIVTTLAWRAPDPFSLLSLAAFVFLLPVQSAINQINAEVTPDHDPNRRFSAWNWVVVVVGGVVLGLAIIGNFVDQEGMRSS